MTDLNTVVTKSPSIVTRKTGSEYVLVPLANNIADMNSVFTLNETGAFLWEQIDGILTIKDLIGALVSEYEIDMEEATNDVLLFINDMSKYLIIK